jgi:hypothetical protein
VIFFSANPEGEAVADYDPDQQYTGPLLCGHLMSLLWQQPLVGDAELEFLLIAMAHYMEEQEADVEQHLVANHFAQGPFSECVVRVVALQKMGGTSVVRSSSSGAAEDGRHQVPRAARKVCEKNGLQTRSLSLSPSCDPFRGADSSGGDVLDVGRLKHVSVDGLVTN